MCGCNEWRLGGGGDGTVSGRLVVELLLLLLVLVLLGLLAAAGKLLISTLAVVDLILLRRSHGRPEEFRVVQLGLCGAGADFGSGRVHRVGVTISVGAIALVGKILRVTFFSPINLLIYHLFLRVLAVTLHFLEPLVAGLFCRNSGANKASAPLIYHHLRGNLLVR